LLLMEDRLRSIDKQRIRRGYSQVSAAELAAVDAGLRLDLGLEPDPG
jgi:mRNA-degrading endonuclease toxin of MazEF toxin-antitoxin module